MRNILRGKMNWLLSTTSHMTLIQRWAVDLIYEPPKAEEPMSTFDLDIKVVDYTCNVT